MDERDERLSNLAKAAAAVGFTGFTTMGRATQKLAIDVEEASHLASLFAPHLKPAVTVDELMQEARDFRASQWQQYWSVKDAVQEVINRRQVRMSRLFPVKWPEDSDFVV